MPDLLIWMYSTSQPHWSMPADSVVRVREALGEEWMVRTVEHEIDATGDGPPATPAPVLEAIADAEVYFGFGIAPDAFREAKRLRWVHSGAAGVGGSLFPEMLESEVLLTNSAGVYAEPMADQALAMMLYFTRALDGAVAGMGAREWRREAIVGPGGGVTELAGAVVGIVGYGGIGRALGRRARALGMRVWALRRREPAAGERPKEVEWFSGASGLDELLRESDYVVLTVPETSETTGLIGGRELALMPRSAVLINVARGRILDEEALAAALGAGRLRGAGLDVFREEPLPPDSPLWELDNVLITPHIGGTSQRFWDRQTELMIRNVGNYLAGLPLENLVDKRLGY
jgi:phosphoglycerate dehydrogenase-like enzyme